MINIQYTSLNIYLEVYTIYKYSYKTISTVRILFVPLWALPVTGASLVQLHVLVFDCEALFKSFDNTGLRRPPTVSKRGMSARSGANWESR